MDNNTETRSFSRPNTFSQVILRFITSAVILAITAFFTPGFTISNIWTLALAAVVLTVIDLLLVKFTGLHASAFGKGFVGFVLAAVVLYVTIFRCRIFYILDSSNNWSFNLWSSRLLYTRTAIKNTRYNLVLFIFFLLFHFVFYKYYLLELLLLLMKVDIYLCFSQL